MFLFLVALMSVFGHVRCCTDSARPRSATLPFHVQNQIGVYYAIHIYIYYFLCFVFVCCCLVFLFSFLNIVLLLFRPYRVLGSNALPLPLSARSSNFWNKDRRLCNVACAICFFDHIHLVRFVSYVMFHNTLNVPPSPWKEYMINSCIFYAIASPR